MCNFGQPLLSSSGLSRIPGMGWDGMGYDGMLHTGGFGAGREGGGSLGSHQGVTALPPQGVQGCWAPPRAAVTLPVASAPLSACDVQLGFALTWLEGALSTPKRAAPQAVKSSWLLGAPRPLSKGHLSLVKQYTQLMWGWGKVSPADWEGHERDDRGWDGGMLLPPCSFQHTTSNLTCSRARS